MQKNGPGGLVPGPLLPPVVSLGANRPGDTQISKGPRETALNFGQTALPPNLSARLSLLGSVGGLLYLKNKNRLGFWLGVHAALWPTYLNIQLLPMNANRVIGVQPLLPIVSWKFYQGQ